MELWIVFILINPFSFPGKGKKKNSKCTLFKKKFFVLNVENEKQNPVKGLFISFSLLLYLVLYLVMLELMTSDFCEIQRLEIKT